MGLIKDVSTWDRKTYGNKQITLRVLVECEMGSTNKYEYDDDRNMMVIVRKLHKDYPYPFSYGSIPQTLAEDGDPLDAILFCSDVIRSGTVVNAIPVGIIKTIDDGEQDDKILCVPFYERDIGIDLKKVVHYIQNYKYPDQSKTTFTGIGTAEDAIEAIKLCHKRFKVNCQ